MSEALIAIGIVFTFIAIIVCAFALEYYPRKGSQITKRFDYGEFEGN